jgi:Ca2+:H+ antiporter
LILTQVPLSYVCSRIYLQHPPGDETNLFMPHPEIPAEALRKEQELAEAQPDVNPWACIVLLIITVALMGVTAEFVRFTRLPTRT